MLRLTGSSPACGGGAERSEAEGACPAALDQLDGPQRAGRVGQQLAVELLAAEAGAGVEAFDAPFPDGGQVRVGAGRRRGARP